MYPRLRESGKSIVGGTIHIVILGVFYLLILTVSRKVGISFHAVKSVSLPLGLIIFCKKTNSFTTYALPLTKFLNLAFGSDSHMHLALRVPA